MAVSRAELLAVACTDCGQLVGQWCRYLPLTRIDPEFLHTYTEATRRRWALTGQPTQRAHNARYNAASMAAWRREHPRRSPRPVTPARPDVRAAWRAMAAFDHREHLALRAWLAEFGKVLTRPGGGP